MSGSVINSGNLRISPWKILPGDNISPEEAAKYSISADALDDDMAEELVFKDHLTDLKEIFPDFKPAKSTAIVKCVIESDVSCRVLISAGADWWMHGFINGKPFGDTAVNGNVSHPITSFDHIYQVTLNAGKNTVIFHLQAGITWYFGVQIFPMPQNWPDDYRSLDILCRNIIDRTCKLLHEPVIHGVSTDSARICAEFTYPVLSVLRWRKSGMKEFSESRITLYGQWEYSQMSCFCLNGLDADSSYEYEICCYDEKTAVYTKIFSGEFRTFPAGYLPHTFAAFSDLQVSPALKHQALRDFAANTPLPQADFIASLGDVASGFGNFSAAYFTDFTDILKECNCRQPLEFSRGNHELWGSESTLYSRYLGTPYGAFQYGDVFYIRLDSGEDQPRQERPCHYTQRSHMSEYYRQQHDFLAEVIRTPACRNARYRIVLAHACPFEFEFPFYGKNIRDFAGEFFYGDDPLCKIDLWLCGDVHSPYRYDPVSGKIHGAKTGRARPANPTEADRRDIRFPVYVNDGPGYAGADLSMAAVKVDADGIHICSYLPDGTVVDDIDIVPGREFLVKKSNYELLWENK